MSDSLFRKLTYKALKNLSLEGDVLDLGGTRGAYYHELLVKSGNITLVNIDETTKPDIVFDLDTTALLPSNDRQYDGVLLINVLEHIYHYEHLLKESFRVMKPGGTMVIVVPFLHQVHGSPHDYFRYTKEALAMVLYKAGFTGITIREIGPGVCAVRANLLHRFLPGFLSPILEQLALATDLLLIFLARTFGKQYAAKEYPLGYCVEAHKR